MALVSVSGALLCWWLDGLQNISLVRYVMSTFMWNDSVATTLKDINSVDKAYIKRVAGFASKVFRRVSRLRRELIEAPTSKLEAVRQQRDRSTAASWPFSSSLSSSSWGALGAL
ncbi:hypothetical protein LY76DRAFT_610882 [Colletotrichum caudatum]|nr:hypothetical protein LY76DRAFT_610882 [Colletotrichum caudatum]